MRIDGRSVEARLPLLNRGHGLGQAIRELRGDRLDVCCVVIITHAEGIQVSQCAASGEDYASST